LADTKDEYYACEEIAKKLRPYVEGNND
jgi:hypothetical protein